MAAFVRKSLVRALFGRLLHSIYVVVVPIWWLIMIEYRVFFDLKKKDTRVQYEVDDSRSNASPEYFPLISLVVVLHGYQVQAKFKWYEYLPWLVEFWILKTPTTRAITVSWSGHLVLIYDEADMRRSWSHPNLSFVECTIGIPSWLAHQCTACHMPSAPPLTVQAKRFCYQNQS